MKYFYALMCLIALAGVITSIITSNWVAAIWAFCSMIWVINCALLDLK